MDSLAYLIGLAINLAVAYYLYTDANKHGRNGVVWGIFGFFFSLITLIAYFVVKSTSKETV